MNRRSFLKGSAATGAVAAAAAASSLPTPAIAQGKQQWKMVTTWPKNFPGLGTGAERLAKKLTAMSDGRIEVKVYAAGELVPAFESFDAVSSGAADMFHGVAYYWQGRSPGFNFFGAVPFGLTAPEIHSWILHGGGQALYDELYGQFNLKPFAAGNTGVQMGGWFNKEINSLDDFKGLKMRMPGLGGEVLRRVGASAVSLPGGEIFPALQSGTIDATEWVGPWNDLAFGFYKIAKYYYWPGFHEPGASLEAVVNKEKYEALPNDLKEIVRVCCMAEMVDTYGEFIANNNTALNTLINDHGVELREFPEDVLVAIGKASGEVVREAAEADEITRKIYDSFISFRKMAIAWGRIAEQGYMNARLLPFDYGA